MNKQQLANRIWASANNMRNKIEANEYKDYILGLIFYKFLSDTEVKYFTEVCEWEVDELPELVENYEDVNMKNAIKEFLVKSEQMKNAANEFAPNFSYERIAKEAIEVYGVDR
jgi:type I restriction-modification system DNA methylase subunit